MATGITVQRMVFVIRVRRIAGERMTTVSLILITGIGGFVYAVIQGRLIRLMMMVMVMTVTIACKSKDYEKLIRFVRFV